MDVIDFHEICEIFKKKNNIVGLTDLKDVKLHVKGEVKCKKTQLMAQQEDMSNEQNILQLAKEAECYRSIQIITGKVKGVTKKLHLELPDIKGNLEIDPGCEFCSYQDTIDIEVRADCKRSDKRSTPVVTVQDPVKRHKYEFSCEVVCEGKVLFVLANGSESVLIEEIMREVNPSLVRPVGKKVEVFWTMTGEYCSSGKYVQNIRIE
ncbi:uncharacterized protein LOC131935837 [Physella acuta]|uniref:uncharacterized protein LOC131935837 n=1 Tax=Physella acuta TaxID=109671 RepID=UPI0027DBC24C|nr:uncharacterized protein LOC131935837 [Physella acuta]